MAKSLKVSVRVVAIVLVLGVVLCPPFGKGSHKFFGDVLVDFRPHSVNLGNLAYELLLVTVLTGWAFTPDGTTRTRLRRLLGMSPKEIKGLAPSVAASP